MSAKRAVAILLLATLGIWGCAKGPGTSSASNAERIKALEAKNAKLEDDFRAAAAVRDQARKKLSTIEDEYRVVRTELDQQLRSTTQERDELKQQLNSRTTERDAMVTQYEQFRKNIRELLGQADAAISKPGDHPVTSAVKVGSSDGL